ncbi:hypothetical protein BYT27DRAFT_7334973 [Phlegmacium glaucopus]|nr:hypothetical protein BYT27DRAFT_7334973 [Phlegmacium glaucopus]
MSVDHQEVFASIQLRSSTPAANEKVFQYLQGMTKAGEEPDNAPPGSVVDADEFRSRAASTRSGARSPQIYSPAPKSKASGTLIGPNGFGTSYQRAGSKVNAGHNDDIPGDDVDSNAQEGVRSEVGEIVPFPEPGPHDLPGPKYESYDSGPSFGNFGPLPTDDHHHASNNPYAHSSWNPVWTEILIKPNGDTPRSNTVQGNVTGLTEGGLNDYSARLASPPPANSAHSTPRQSSVIIDVESPSSKSRPGSERNITTSPKPPSRVQSRATNKGEVDQRPWSPLSGRSKVTRATEIGTVYPPLPESRMGDGDTSPEGYASPVLKSRARSMAPSISPPDSPSQRIQLFASKPHYSNGGSRSPPPGSVMSGGHQSRPFSPYRHAPTQEDLLNAAVRGRALTIPEEPEKERSVASTSPSKMPSRQSKVLSHIEGGKPLSQISAAKPPSVVPSHTYRSGRIIERDQDVTPTPSRPHSPEGLDAEEARIVHDALAAQTPRTSIYAAPLEPEVASHYHDMELCVLLHQENDPAQHEIVKKALRKAVRQRVKKLGMKYDNESIRQYRKSFHDHDPSVHLRADYLPEEPPKWASDLKREIVLMQQRIESLGPKIEGLRDRSFNGGSRFANEADESTETPMTQTVNIQTQPTGTLADSMYHTPATDVFIDDDGNVVREYDDFTENHNPHTDAETRSLPQSVYQQSENENDRDNSPGKQYLEEELYKLRQKPQGSQSGRSHRSWELARDDDHNDYEDNGHVQPSGLPTIPDTNGDGYVNGEGEGEGDRSLSPPLPDLPEEATQAMAVHPQGPWGAVDYNTDAQRMSPWQRIHGRLLNWAMVWPMSELENALNSSTRGQQVDEVALTIWSTQTYKRYVRARLTDSPHGVVDRLFVPPNVADSINNAVYNGRHGDACGMLRDLWAPFGLEGMPRLLVVLAKHRLDPNHWVVHRFSLPDGGLTTYDSYPERTLPDGRPLGWWFAIRVAWPNAMYPSPDHLMQKMVRLHRPMQLPIDNSVAAAGIWRNILMGSRAERSLDLERLRDLINTEVKNLKQRKHLGKLSVGVSRLAWEDMS